MAKLRKNHQSKGSAAGGGMITKVGIFGALLAALAYFFGAFSGGEAPAVPNDRVDYAGEEYFTPTGTRGEQIDYQGFSLSYDEEWEQAEWVAYILERKNIQQKWVKRPRGF
ncbi:MAG: endonuclease G, partial [Bdellovibrionota bacterium]